MDPWRNLARGTAEGALPWTVCPYPTPGYAQSARVSLASDEDFSCMALACSTATTLRRRGERWALASSV